MELFDIARCVKAGARFLDKKIPNWRSVLRKHSDEFDFADGEHCVLGTLEHYSGRMRVLKARGLKNSNYAFTRAYTKLGIEDRVAGLGFDYNDTEDGWSDEHANNTKIFNALWRAEFEK